MASSLPLTVELLVARLGVAGMDTVFTEYAAAGDPALWGSDEGRRFAAWAAARFPGDGLVGAALGLDLAGLDHVRTGQPQTVALGVDPRALIAAVHARRDPADVPTGRYLATVG